MNKIAIVILNWNGKGFLEKFLPSVIKFSQNAEIIIADNCSTDNSIDFLIANYPEIRIIKLKENYGFAKGYNEALKEVNATYFVLLNSDVEVTENWLNPCIKLLESDAFIGACQPKIKAYHNKEYFEYAGAAGGFIDKYGYPFCRGRIFDTLEKDTSQYDNETEVFWASGACLFVKSSVFSQLGGFDATFFAHMEEIDLCWRMQHLGYKVMFTHLSTVYHVGGGTLNKTNPRKTFLNFRNNLLMLYKNLPKQKRFSIILIRLLLDGIAGIKFLVEGKPKHTLAVIKAHFAFYKLRHAYPSKNIPCLNLKGYYNKNILVSYYLKKQRLFSKIGFR